MGYNKSKNVILRVFKHYYIQNSELEENEQSSHSKNEHTMLKNLKRNIFDSKHDIKVLALSSSESDSDVSYT